MTARPLSFEDFSSRVGQSFAMRFATEETDGTAAGTAAAGLTQGGAAELVLTECTLGSIPGMSRSFNLLFRAGPDAPREQGNYLLSREDFGPSVIFLVPVRAIPDGVEFHAVFNHLTEE